MDRLHRWRPHRDGVPIRADPAGLHAIEITETHRVHQHASAAIIRARKPSSLTAAGSPLTRSATPR